MTVSLFGHRIMQNSVAAADRLRRIVNDLLSNEEFVEFLVGRDGDFDLLAASIIRTAMQKINRQNASLILVLPYPRAEIIENETFFLDYYDDIEICDAAQISHYKSAFWIRNRQMIDRSDLVIVCLEHSKGGTARAANYATHRGIKVLNVAVE